MSPEIKDFLMSISISVSVDNLWKVINREDYLELYLEVKNSMFSYKYKIYKEGIKHIETVRVGGWWR